MPTSFSAGDLTLAQFQAQAIPLILAPYGFNGVLTKFSADGKSIYHGGSFKAERRFSNGLFFTANYTWSKTIDTVENELFTSSLNPRRPFNLNDINHFRGLSGIHRAHKVTMAWIYQFPKYAGDNAWIRGFANGWQWGGAYVFETGQPVTIQALRDVDGNLDTAGDFAFHNPNGTSGVGADSRTVCWNGAAVSFGCNTAAQIVGYVSLVDNAEWIRPGLGGVANGGRGTHIAGQINNWNMEFSKRTPFWGEGRYIEISAQFINVFNPPLELPAHDVTGRHVYYMYTVLAPRREELRAFLDGRGIRTQLIYPKLVPDQGAYRDHPWRAADPLEVARSLVPRLLCLPMFAELADPEIERVAAAIRDFYGAG